MVAGIGRARHDEAVTRLRESYTALPNGAPVRLRKPTSNLFRPRAEEGRGLDVSGLTGVVDVDEVAATADVQGMCTYEDLVATTLPLGLMPLVVPQLRTITLGGAVTGLGIESTSFRNGLPHESVTEMDVLTGAGDLVTVRPGDDLFDAFANSYGSLGYVVRLRIELERVPAYAALRHVRVALDRLGETVEHVTTERAWAGEQVDALDGVAFSPDEVVLTMARWSDEEGPTSDYTGERIYFRSLQERESDRLTLHDYLWRWDTDWFWCSGAFGLHDPRVRRLWPRRWRRSDVYHRLVGLDRRVGFSTWQARRQGVQKERVVQDVEIPLERTAEFLTWFDREVGMRPVWLCPLRLREPTGPDTARAWPTYPLEPGRTYVNLGFWGQAQVPVGSPPGLRNRAVEDEVARLGGHKSLYSEAFYDRDAFDSLYGTTNLARVKRETDPDGRLTQLYDKVVTGR